MGFKIRYIESNHSRYFKKIGHENGVNCINFSVNGELFSTGGNDKVIMVWKSNLPSYELNQSQ